VLYLVISIIKLLLSTSRENTQSNCFNGLFDLLYLNLFCLSFVLVKISTYAAMKNSLFAVIVLYAGQLYAQSVTKTPGGVIERISPELDAIINTTAKVEVVADGFGWVEGPLWIESQKMLLVSDVLSNNVYKWTAEKGKELYLEHSGYTQKIPRTEELGSNGLALSNEGRLILCQHGDRRVALMNASLDHPKADYTTLAGEYKGKKFDSPNDLVIKKNGDIYFTDPPYGLEKGVKNPSKAAPYQGVYRISKNGTVSLLTDTLSRPNGIAFFPGEKSLLIANSDPQKPNIYHYDVDKEGLLRNGRIFIKERSTDGIKIDKAGNVFATGQGGVWIYNKKGVLLGKIKVNGSTSNCAFTNDHKTLFITADDYLLKVDLAKKAGL
jgi:gluconolactonase